MIFYLGQPLHTAKDNPIQLLDLQYRMHPQISLFPARYIYQGRLKDERYICYQCCIFKDFITDKHRVLT